MTLYEHLDQMLGKNPRWRTHFKNHCKFEVSPHLNFEVNRLNREFDGVSIEINLSLADNEIQLVNIIESRKI